MSSDSLPLPTSTAQRVGEGLRGDREGVGPGRRGPIPSLPRERNAAFPAKPGDRGQVFVAPRAEGCDVDSLADGGYAFHGNGHVTGRNHQPARLSFTDGELVSKILAIASSA